MRLWPFNKNAERLTTLKILLYNDRCIVSAKTKCIAQRSPYGSLFWLPESEVEFRIQTIIISKVIDGWRNDIVNN